MGRKRGAKLRGEPANTGPALLQAALTRENLPVAWETTRLIMTGRRPKLTGFLKVHFLTPMAQSAAMSLRMALPSRRNPPMMATGTAIPFLGKTCPVSLLKNGL